MGETKVKKRSPAIIRNDSASEPHNDSFLDRVEREMQDTRNFLANWFAGRAEKPEYPGDFYLKGVLTKDFHTVRPSGTRLDRQQTLDCFYDKLYGSDPGVLCPENDNIVTLLSSDTLVIVGYDESHVYPNEIVVHALTAAFVKDANAPNGVAWLLVHETLINGGK